MLLQAAFYFYHPSRIAYMLPSSRPIRLKIAKDIFGNRRYSCCKRHSKMVIGGNPLELCLEVVFNYDVLPKIAPPTVLY